MSDTNGWNKYEKLIIDTMDRHEKKLDALDEKVSRIDVSVGKLQVKSGFWGAIGGFISVVVAILIGFITGNI